MVPGRGFRKSSTHPTGYGRSTIANQRVNHGASIRFTHIPVISQRPAFAAKPEPFDQANGGNVLRVDQRLDAMRREDVGAVIDQGLNSLFAKALSLMFSRYDVADFKAPISRFAVVIIDHSNAFVVRSIRDHPGEVIIGAGRFSEPLRDFPGVVQRVAGCKIPKSHEFKVAEACMETCYVSGLDPPETQAPSQKNGKCVGLLYHPVLQITPIKRDQCTTCAAARLESR
jgi:hypothetical protein